MLKTLQAVICSGIIFLMCDSAVAQIRVAITPFEASNSALRRHAEYARGELENLIVENFDAIVVERARMDRVVEDISLDNFSGLIDPSDSVNFGRMSGAQMLIIGSILKADTQQKNYSGLPTGRFRLRTKSANTEVTVRIRAVDLERSVVVFSTTLKGSSTSFSTNFGGSGDRDQVSMAVEHALSKLAGNAKFAALFKENAGRSSAMAQIEVEISPTPDNCDIEINGVFYGSSPMTVKLDSGTTVVVKISKQGYEIWEKKLIPREGMKITSELAKVSGN